MASANVAGSSTRLEPAHRGPGYRPEIDGLRAFAVIPVILFHARIWPFSGGFVGVDVFFVISGFLITRICLTELAEDRFSLLRFFERRARRILPALFLVVAACIPFAWALMLPDPLENFGQSIVATVLSANNILLYLTTGYWDLAAEFKPLLHTWSLAVEEQYYLIFPAALWGLTRVSPRWTTATLTGATIVSLALSVWAAEAAPEGNFYLLPTRAFELLAGSLCAAVGDLRPTRFKGLLTAIGVLLIVGSSIAYDEVASFPSLYALAPVGGTALVILFGQERSLATRILSWRGFVAIGLISYSLYLWHQPLFAFTRIGSISEPGPGVFAVLIAFCVPLSYVSWRFVEQPSRDRKRLPGRTLFPALVIIAGLLCSFGATLALTHGAPSRVDVLPAGTGGHIAYNERIRSYFADDFPDNGRHNVLILGNSFARDVANMALESGYLDGKNLVYRSDFSVCDEAPRIRALMAKADEVFFASGNFSTDCLARNLALAKNLGAKPLVFGPKSFGYNLNVFKDVPKPDRADVRVPVDDGIVATNVRQKAALPPEIYVDFLDILSKDGRLVRLFDDDGMLLSPDRRHLTQSGAKYLGRQVFGERGQTSRQIKDTASSE